MADLTAFADLIPQDHGLCTVVALRPDGSPHTSVVNAGVLSHPRRAEDVLAFVLAGGAHKPSLLRADRRVAVVARAGWRWAAVEGTAELIGPDDGDPDPESLRVLIRAVFETAGGTHEDWDEFDR